MILIVEDEVKIARFVQLELEHEGYRVRHIADGREALESALKHDYELLVHDLMLPGLSGTEVLKRLRRVKDTPVIVLTARDRVVDKVEGLDTGANDYMTKPFAIEELLARIRVHLEKRRAARAAADVRQAGGGHRLPHGDLRRRARRPHQEGIRPAGVSVGEQERRGDARAGVGRGVGIRISRKPTWWTYTVRYLPRQA